MRYLPLTDADRQAMLAKIGAPSMDDLFEDVPFPVRRKGPFEGLPSHMPEYEVERALTALAGKNISAGSCPFFIGCGAYRHHVPAAVDQLLLRGEFLTSYTPYQPEVAQGTLQYLFEFQTQVARLTAMEVANASMYDGPTACAEAVMMANRVTGRTRAVIAGHLHPHYRECVDTMAKMTGFTIEIGKTHPTNEEKLADLVNDRTSCVVVQTPDFFGNLYDFTNLAATCKQKGALLIVVVTEIVSLGLLKPPGEMGADIVVAEGQGLGNGLNFGGPYVGLFACKEKYIRQMPGRLCGETLDSEGRRGYVLTLSTREQHIRREKATSNICTNSGLCALGFTIHLSLLGERGLKHLAALNHSKALQLADRLNDISDCKVTNENFFNEFTISLPKMAGPIVEELARRPILAGVPVSRFFPYDRSLANLLVVSATELTTEEDMEAFADALSEVCE